MPPIVAQNTMGILRRFYRDRLAEVAADATFAAREDPASPTVDNVWTSPPGLPSGFPENRRGVLIREVPTPFATLPGQITVARFYVTTYGAEPEDADYLGRLLYGFSLEAIGGGYRWRVLPWKVGSTYVKSVRYEGKPVVTPDSNGRTTGFLIANMRIGIVK
jgi:hypothetical protein